jgi:hypothetical protein
MGGCWQSAFLCNPHQHFNKPLTESKNDRIIGKHNLSVVAPSKLMLLCNALEVSLNLLIFKKFSHLTKLPSVHQEPLPLLTPPLPPQANDVIQPLALNQGAFFDDRFA